MLSQISISIYSILFCFEMEGGQSLFFWSFKNHCGRFLFDNNELLLWNIIDIIMFSLVYNLLCFRFPAISLHREFTMLDCHVSTVSQKGQTKHWL